MELLKKHMLPLFSLLGGVAACLLRLLLRKSGFEAATGLPIAGNRAAVLLPLLLLAFLMLLAVMAHRLPREDTPAFPTCFSTSDAVLLTLPVMGILLLGCSGLSDALSILSPELVSTGHNSPQLQLISSATALFSALALLSLLAVCKKRGCREAELPAKQPTAAAYRSELLLIPPVCLVVRLVLAYRLHSVDPVLSKYYIGMLALIFTTLAFYRLSSFAFQSGSYRRFSFYSGAAVMFSIAALAEGGQPSELLLYAGSTLTLLGFLLLYQPHSSL